MLAASNFKASAYTVPLALANSGEGNIINRSLTEQNYHLFSDLYFLTGVIFMTTAPSVRLRPAQNGGAAEIRCRRGPGRSDA